MFTVRNEKRKTENKRVPITDTDVKNGKVLFFCGAEPKAGTTMLSRCVAQLIAKKTGNKVLWTSWEEQDCVLTKDMPEGTSLREAGIPYMENFQYEDSPKIARLRYHFTVIDGGSCPLPEQMETLRQLADQCFLVADQCESSFKKAELALKKIRLANDYIASFGKGYHSDHKTDLKGDNPFLQEPPNENVIQNNDRWTMLINRVQPDDPHDLKYCRERFGDVVEGLYAIPYSEKGRMADWDSVTLLEVKDKNVERAIENILKGQFV